MLPSFYSPNDPNLLSTSDSRSINAAIRAAHESGCNTVVIPRANQRTGRYEWIIDESILLPDGITVILDGCTMIQAEGCYCNMFRTATAFDKGARTLDNEQKDIRLLGRNGALLDGGVYNGHSEWTDKDGSLINNTMLLFANLRGFTVEGFKVRHQRWWGMTFYSCCHGTIRNIEFEADFASVGPSGERLDEEPTDYAHIYIKNGDGIDIRCGCSDILIENITGQTEDDTVALTALKGRHETRYFVPEKGWDIHNIIIKNVMSRAFSGAQLRLLCADGTRVHDITADTLIDTSAHRAWENSVFLGHALPEYIRGRTSIRGEMFNIALSNIHSNSQRAILVGCSVENLRISNLFCQKDVRFAVISLNQTELHAALIDGVYCEEGACPEAVFSFCEQTTGELSILNVFPRENIPLLLNSGSIDVSLGRD